MSGDHVIGSMSDHSWTVALLSFLAIIAIPIYRVTLHPLARYPGPLSWSITRIPWHVSLHRGRLHRDIHELHQKYGQVVRIAPNELSFTQPDAFRDIYVTRAAHKLIPRNNVWFSPPPGSEPLRTIVTADEADHAQLRRAFSGAFTDAGIKEMGLVVTRHVDLLIDQLRIRTGHAEAEGPGALEIDLVDWINFTTFDISGELSFGEGFGSIKAGKAHPWVDISCKFGQGVAMFTSLGFLKPLGRILAFVVPEEVRRKGIYHHELAAERVGKRLGEAKGRADFLGAVEKYNEDCEKKGHVEKQITRKEMNINMSIFVFVASETTSSALSSIFHHLLQDRKLLDRLVKEIDQKLMDTTEITVAGTSNMTFLDAVISEGMRVGPPAAVANPRMIPPGGDDICGQILPEGTFVSASTYAAFRSADNFHHPDEFVPERFLGDERKWQDKMGVFQPFGAGRHMCMGYKLAWLTMRLIIVRLLHAFDVEMVGEKGEWGQQKSYIVWEKEPMKVKLWRRNGGSVG